MLSKNIWTEKMSTNENLAELAREGYLPTDVNTGDGVVTFSKLAHASFRESFYSQTVASVDAGMSKQIPFHAIVDQFSDRGDDQHLRLIAHTSRCGSTLLSNLLSLRSTTMVLKEPDFVTLMARRIALAPHSSEAENFDSLMTALLNFSCHVAAASGRELVIKLMSWISPSVLASLSNCRNTTWLLVWREPEKVVASNMAKHPSWGRDTEEGCAARCATGIADIATGSAELYAHTWSRIVDSFTSMDSGLRWRTLEYEDLTSKKAASFVAVEDWFNLTTAAGLPDKFADESSRYSKGSGAEIFEPTKAHRRAPLESSQERKVSVITKRALNTLRSDKRHRLWTGGLGSA
ncbi:hypothetical protein [Mycobacterium haemophilum]|nr:hypothetical protein [Mycobacterium haemophilum]MCV7341802.1 hypothetical protein [Mycobacterium haemophilum DSM 44634]